MDSKRTARKKAWWAWALVAGLVFIAGTPGVYAQDLTAWKFTITVPDELDPDDLDVVFTGTGGSIANVSVVPADAVVVVGGNQIDASWGAPLADGTVVMITFTTEPSGIEFDGGNWTVGGVSVQALLPGDEDSFETISMIPTLSPVGLFLLVMVLGAAMILIRRQRSNSPTGRGAPA